MKSIRIQFWIGPSDLNLNWLRLRVKQIESVEYQAKYVKEILIQGITDDDLIDDGSIKSVRVDLSFSPLNPCLTNLYFELERLPNHAERINYLKRKLISIGNVKGQTGNQITRNETTHSIQQHNNSNIRSNQSIRVPKGIDPEFKASIDRDLALLG